MWNRYPMFSVCAKSMYIVEECGEDSTVVSLFSADLYRDNYQENASNYHHLKEYDESNDPNDPMDRQQ